jgi:hypothetical protein
MLSKVATRMSSYQQLTSLSTRAMATKKPSIGDAVTILQSKVSGINQVVSSSFFQQKPTRPFASIFVAASDD